MKRKVFKDEKDNFLAVVNDVPSTSKQNYETLITIIRSIEVVKDVDIEDMELTFVFYNFVNNLYKLNFEKKIKECLFDFIVVLEDTNSLDRVFEGLEVYTKEFENLKSELNRFLNRYRG